MTGFSAFFQGKSPIVASHYFVAGTMMGHSVSGFGRTKADAMARAMGEAAEIAALLADAKHPAGRPSMDIWTRFVHTDAGVDWIAPTEPGPIHAVPGPALGFDGVWRPPATEGCGAGRTGGAALHQGLLELVERDAVALWWYGGRKAHLFRQRTVDRPHGLATHEILLDVTVIPGIPVIVAVSFDSSGRMFTCGSAADLTQRAAANRAIAELGQMQTGHYFVRQKLQHLGAEALTPQDRAAIRLASAIHRDDMLSEAVDNTGKADAGPTHHPSHGLSARLSVADIRTAHVNLGIHMDLHVVKAVSPDLQPSTDTVRTERLIQALRASSGGFRCFQGLPYG